MDEFYDQYLSLGVILLWFELMCKDIFQLGIPWNVYWLRCQDAPCRYGESCCA
jgi:hypothetical protein